MTRRIVIPAIAQGEGMIFRKAEIKEQKKIADLYRSVIGMPFCSWNEYYPGEEEIRGDLAAESLYVLEENGELIGAISIVPENELDELDCWTVKENAREFARVVLRPGCQHKGRSYYLVEGILQELQKQHVGAVHISVVKKNLPALKLYENMCFVRRGEADLYGHSFYLCEKILRSGDCEDENSIQVL